MRHPVPVRSNLGQRCYGRGCVSEGDVLAGSASQIVVAIDRQDVVAAAIAGFAVHVAQT